MAASHWGGRPTPRRRKARSPTAAMAASRPMKAVRPMKVVRPRAGWGLTMWESRAAKVTTVMAATVKGGKGSAATVSIEGGRCWACLETGWVCPVGQAGAVEPGIRPESHPRQLRTRRVRSAGWRPTGATLTRSYANRIAVVSSDSPCACRYREAVADTISSLPRARAGECSSCAVSTGTSTGTACSLEPSSVGKSSSGK